MSIQPKSRIDILPVMYIGMNTHLDSSLRLMVRGGMVDNLLHLPFRPIGILAKDHAVTLGRRRQSHKCVARRQNASSSA